MIVPVSEAPTVPDEHRPPSRSVVPDERRPTPRPPVTVQLGGLLIPIAAGVCCTSAVLVVAARFEADDHAAAVFAAIAVLGGVSLVASLLLVAFGSIWWAVRLRRHARGGQKLPTLLTRGLIAWAAAITVGIAALVGLGDRPNVSYALMSTSFALWAAGAVFLAVGSYNMRAPRPHRLSR